MVKLISCIMACLFWGVEPSGSNNETCTLSVQFTNFRNEEGKLFIFLYNYENQYPDNPYKYFEINKKQITNSRILVNIKDLKKGNYALSILDDENGNDDLDMFLGIPTEGYAFSNNVKPFLSLPDYHDLLFNLDNHQQMKIEMRYAL